MAWEQGCEETRAEELERKGEEQRGRRPGPTV